jgi:hypothetical protein
MIWQKSSFKKPQDSTFAVTIMSLAMAMFLQVAAVAE